MFQHILFQVPPSAAPPVDAQKHRQADQVLPQLRRRYRVASGPGSTAIIGSSNGAIHALFAGLHRPDTFGLVGCLSYARLMPEHNVQMLERLTEVPDPYAPWTVIEAVTAAVTEAP